MLQHSRTTFRMPIRTNVTYDRATRKTPIHVLMEMALNHAPDGRLTREGISSSIRHYRTNFADRTVSHNLTMNDAFVKTTPSGCWALSGAVNRQPSKKERKLRKKLKEAGPVADLPYPISASTSPSNSNITLSPSPPPNISLNHQTPYVDAAQTNGVSTRAASRPSRAKRAKPYKRHSATTFTGSQEVVTLPSAGPELLPPMQPINPVTSNTGMSMMSGSTALTQEEYMLLTSLGNTTQANFSMPDAQINYLLEALNFNVPAPINAAPSFVAPVPYPANPYYYYNQAY